MSLTFVDCDDVEKGPHLSHLSVAMEGQQGAISLTPPPTINYVISRLLELLASQRGGSDIPSQQFGYLHQGPALNMQAPALYPSMPMWQREVPNPTQTLADAYGVPGNKLPNLSPDMLLRAPSPFVNYMAPHVMSPSPPVIPRAAPITQNYIRMRPPEQEEPMQYHSSVLDPGSQHSVYVSHVEDGPFSFSVQLVSSHPLLNSLMLDINSRYPTPLTEGLKCGTMCLARYMEDNLLCRAVILSVSKKSSLCKVHFVDYGNSDNVPISQIFVLPTELAVPKVSFCCLNFDQI